MTSPTPPPWKPSSTGCWTTPPRNYPRWPTTSTRPGPTYWPSPPSPKPCGPRSGPTTPKSASTVRSAAAPIRWASSPPATPLPAWSEPSWPSKPTNGPKDAATSASTSWPAAASPPSTTPQTRSPPNQNTHSNSPHNQPTKDQPLHHYKGLDRRIVLPLAKPALGVLAVWTFITYWNSFLWPLIIVDDLDSLATIPLGLQSFFGEHGASWNLILAASVVSIVPTMLIVIALQKHLVKGIAMAGLRSEEHTSE